MSDLASTLRTRLQDLVPSALEIHDDSAEHVGHAGAAGGGVHLQLAQGHLAVADQLPVGARRLDGQCGEEPRHVGRLEDFCKLG